MPKDQFKHEDRKVDFLKDPLWTLQGPAAGTTKYIEYRDPSFPNMTFRVSAKGSKTWNLKFEKDKNPLKTGTALRRGIGDYGNGIYGKGSRSKPITPPAVAIALYWQHMAELKAGVDPWLVAANRTTVDEAIRALLDDPKVKEKKSYQKLVRAFERFIPKTMLPNPIDEFNHAHWVEIKTPIYARATDKRKMHGAVREAWSIISALLNHAGVPNKLRGDRPPKSEKQTRHLSFSEIAALWTLLRELCPESHLGDIICLELATGQRIEEICQMRRDQIKAAPDYIWTNPYTKNGKEHQVPLGRVAWRIIQKRLLATGNSESGVLFPGKDENTHIDPNRIGALLRSFFQAGVHEGRKSNLGALKIDGKLIAKFTSHACRRTCSTLAKKYANVKGLADLGLQLNMADAYWGLVMNHKGEIKTTMRELKYTSDIQLLPQKTDATMQWDKLLERIIKRDPDLLRLEAAVDAGASSPDALAERHRYMEEIDEAA